MSLTKAFNLVDLSGLRMVVDKINKNFHIPASKVAPYVYMRFGGDWEEGTKEGEPLLLFRMLTNDVVVVTRITYRVYVQASLSKISFFHTEKLILSDAFSLKR